VATEFKLPELGENITSGDVLRVMVSPGDTIAEDQVVLELETDKATVEVPSSVSGKVKDVQVKAGDKLKVGQVILTVEAGQPEAPGQEKKADAGAEKAEADAQAPESAPAEPAPQTGKEKAAPRRDTEKAGEPAATAAAAAAPAAATAGRAEPAPEGKQAAAEAEKAEDAQPDEEPNEEAASPPPARRGEVVDIGRGSPRAVPERPRQIAAAAPSVRRLARELGVDIGRVPGSGPDGRIGVADVKAYAQRMVTGAAKREAPGGAGQPLPDFARWGEVERKAMRPVRRKTAERVAIAWSTVPHVTQHDRADITSLDQLIKRYEKKVAAAGGKLTLTAVVIKVIASAIQQFPQFNSSVDMEREEIIYKKYVNIGIAVDTEHGLLVPVVRNADRKNIVTLSTELNELAEKARNRKLSLEEMEGGSITITNLGGIGGTYFSPIINIPEVAILGISRAALQPVYSDGQLTPRLLLPLSLSYDHRVIDGADAIRFLRWVIEALEQPFVLTLQG
jgi:pyruvate dehydrogenase E2 component (dihydrolipoamide acetyltransferase)